MKVLVGVAAAALAILTAPAMAQSTSGDSKAKGVRMACKQEAVTGSFTRKARQCRHAVGAPGRDEAKAKAQHAGHAQPAAAAPAVPATPASAAATPPAAEGTNGNQ